MVNFVFFEGESSKSSGLIDPLQEHLSLAETCLRILKMDSLTAFSLDLERSCLGSLLSWIELSLEMYRSITFSFSELRMEVLLSIRELILEIAWDLDNLEFQNSEMIEGS